MFLNSKETKLINETFYTQSLIRNKSLGYNNQLITNDNHLIIKKLKGNKPYLIGNSINTQNKVISNRFNSKFKVSTNLGFKSSTQSFLKKYETSFKSIVKQNFQSKLITVTKKIKGGMYGVASGLHGFIPRKHYAKAVRKITIKKSKKLNSFIALKKLSKFFTLKIPLETANLSLYPYSEVSRFSRNKNIRKYYPKNNLVFTLKKDIYKRYENKKKTGKSKNNKLSKKQKISINRRS